jgi:hypothetical protein
MLTRVALFAASLTASAVLAIGLALFGLAPASPTADPVVTMDAAAAADVAPAPVTQIDTVYVVPPTAKPTPEPTPSPIVIKRIVTTHSGDDDGGEHGDD